MKIREIIMKKRIATTLFYKYDVTTTFVLLALLNLGSPWGNISFRVVMVLMNIVVGASMEYLINRFSLIRHPLFKGLVALILLFINVIWILATLLP